MLSMCVLNEWIVKQNKEDTGLCIVQEQFSQITLDKLCELGKSIHVSGASL